MDSEAAPAVAESTFAAALLKFARGLVHYDTKPRLIVDSECLVRWASPSARKFLHRPMPVHIHDNRLIFEEDGETKTCRTFVETVAERRQRLFVRGDSDRAWTVMIGWSEKIEGERLLFLEFALPTPGIESAESGMREQFGLTPAECAVIDRLARLFSPAQIAEDLGVAVQTVRTHVKRIYAKLGISTHSQLLQISRAFCDG